MDAVSGGSVPRLFAAFADLQRSAPKDLQWLLVLACWLSNAAGPSSASLGPQQRDGSPRRQATVDKPLNPTLEKGLRSDTDAAHLVAPEAADSGGSCGQTALDSSAEEALQIQASSLRDKKMRLRRAKAITTEVHLQHDGKSMEALLPYYCISSTGCS